MQKALCQMVTDILNFELIDKGYKRMINRFKVCMQKPVTQEDIDKKSDLSSELRNISDIINTLGDMDDKIAKMRILKSLLSRVLADQEVTNILQEYIEKLKSEDSEDEDKKESSELGSSGLGGSPSSDLGTIEDTGFEDFGEEEETFSPLGGAPSTQESESEERSESEELPEEDVLPNPSDLGVDMTQNPQR